MSDSLAAALRKLTESRNNTAEIPASAKAASAGVAEHEVAVERPVSAIPPHAHQHHSTAETTRPPQQAPAAQSVSTAGTETPASPAVDQSEHTAAPMGLKSVVSGWIDPGHIRSTSAQLQPEPRTTTDLQPQSPAPVMPAPDKAPLILAADVSVLARLVQSVREYRAVTAVFILALVVTAVWQDLQRQAAVTKSSDTVNLEQILQEFETADPAAARDAATDDSEMQWSSMSRPPEPQTAGPRSVNGNSISYSAELELPYRQGSSTTAVYPDELPATPTPQPEHSSGSARLTGAIGGSQL